MKEDHEDKSLSAAASEYLETQRKRGALNLEDPDQANLVGRQLIIDAESRFDRSRALMRRLAEPNPDEADELARASAHHAALHDATVVAQSAAELAYEKIQDFLRNGGHDSVDAPPAMQLEMSALKIEMANAEQMLRIARDEEAMASKRLQRVRGLLGRNAAIRQRNHILANGGMP